MRYFRAVYLLLADIFENRALLWQMTKRDFRQRYLGSYLGVLWAFIQPAVTIFIFWFVFQVGFKSKPVDNFPFVLWLVCGMFPWFFLSDGINGAAMAILESSFLVKKVVFRVEILPMVKIFSALIVHAFFLCVLFGMFLAYGYGVSLYNLQFLYYTFAMICFVLGLSWITSALIVFLRDIGQFIAMVMQLLFWGTPIFWSLQMIPMEYQIFFKLNPVYYLIEGYRQSFIYHEWFWQHMTLTLYFWGITVVLMFVGAVLFKKLRPHFADVL